MIDIDSQVAESLRGCTPRRCDRGLGRRSRAFHPVPSHHRSEQAQASPAMASDAEDVALRRDGRRRYRLVVLAVGSPWRGGPTIIERATAAITAPAPGEILQESIALRSGPFNPHGAVNIHVWLDAAPPHRFRVRFDRQRTGRCRRDRRGHGRPELRLREWCTCPGGASVPSLTIRSRSRRVHPDGSRIGPCSARRQNDDPGSRSAPHSSYRAARGTRRTDRVLLRRRAHLPARTDCDAAR